MYKKFGKRALDVMISIFILLILSPLFLVVFFTLLLQNRGTPFFFQKRPGLNENTFEIIKFKTMNDKTDSNGKLLPDNHRITYVGRVIRKLSIDELPQLINVLKGDMSLIGPRPLLIRYLPLYTHEQKRRHLVKPGITGWAQVNGRNSISWSKKFELDIYYVNNLSFMLDLKILFLTIVKVLKRQDINQSEFRPMEPFNGKN